MYLRNVAVLVLVLFCIFKHSASEAAELNQVVDKRAVWHLDAGRVIVKQTIQGRTHYTYDENNVLQTQTDSFGVIGNYKYDDSGRLKLIEFSNGKTVVLVYSRQAGLEELTTDKKRVRVLADKKGARSIRTIDTPSSVAFQKSVDIAYTDSDCQSADDNGCTVFVPGHRDEDEEGGGGGGGGGIGVGAGGGSGSAELPRAPTTSPKPMTPLQCKAQLCDAADNYFMTYCSTETNPRNNALCKSKASDYYANCLRSCDTGDWRWLDDWNYYYR
ncbi:hypothetical protein [Janthinobacterium violaceinigrum]|uniref:RHS repeat protein n=1 Tax=Janthinobacterium violaceinigrum TaxID=2654252 RepID=A0A6I1I5K3_9BURK|nr:hypothetical protein [Janthinobacterium violaceinigrum]KAB8066254.1 hypothetical protein GCN75_03405 [Janthinobacterium violaceinigrum]